MQALYPGFQLLHALGNSPVKPAPTNGSTFVRRYCRVVLQDIADLVQAFENAGF